MAIVPDKSLKQTLYHHIINNIRNVNTKGKRNDALNRSVQIFLHKTIAQLNKTKSYSQTQRRPPTRITTTEGDTQNQTKPKNENATCCCLLLTIVLAKLINIMFKLIMCNFAT